MTGREIPQKKKAPKMVNASLKILIFRTINRVLQWRLLAFHILDSIQSTPYNGSICTSGCTLLPSLEEPHPPPLGWWHSSNAHPLQSTQV